MNHSNSCPICEKHKLKLNTSLIFEGKCWSLYAGPYESHVPGYLYLEPLRHVEYWGELTTEELIEMAKAIPMVENILMKQFPIERLYIVTISEAVRHLHLHLIPRMKEQEVKGISLITQATQQKANVGWGSQTQYDQCILVLKTEFEKISL